MNCKAKEYQWMPIEDRFLRSVVIADSGCITWIGAVKPNGYGTISRKNKTIHAHRYSYEHYVGEIPKGMQLDHLCGVRNCVNPIHLEAVSQKENLRRGSSPSAKNSRRSHCIHGHLLSGDNLYIRLGRGGRMCKTCGKERARMHMAKFPPALSVPCPTCSAGSNEECKRVRKCLGGTRARLHKKRYAKAKGQQ